MTTQTQATTGRRYQHIDALRALAVMLVVVAHAGLGWIVPGGSGVTIFFAVSGFIISTLMIREHDRTAGFSSRSFYVRRALKILPPLFVVVILPSTVVLITGAEGMKWSGLLAQMFFVYNWYEISNGPHGVLVGSQVVWSLAIEEQFYLVFAPLWLVATRLRRAKRFLFTGAAIVAAASLLLKVILALGENTERIYRGTDTRIDAIALGVMVACIVSAENKDETGLRSSVLVRRLNAMRRMPWSLALAGLLYLITLIVRDPFFRDTVRYPLQACAALIVVVCGFTPEYQRFGLLLRRVWESGPIQFIGVASYSIYLTHLTIIVLLKPWLAEWPATLGVTANVALSLLSGGIVYMLVEKPFERLRSRLR